MSKAAEFGNATVPPSAIDLLLSLPINMHKQLAYCNPAIAERAFLSHDPPELQLCSGGGSAHVLHQAWMESQEAGKLSEWVAKRRSIMIHGGGESRRLPAYAATGKLFIPIPVLRWARGQRLGQNLLDLNERFLVEVYRQAGRSAQLLIASGDVLLRTSGRVSELPDADVVLLGMWTSPEVAQNYGVLFCDRKEPQRLVTFLQKPSPDEIRERSRATPFLIDIGAWLLSERAVNCLLAKCGWDDEQGRFANSLPEPYDLYGEWALCLGAEAEIKDHAISQLSVAVAPIDDGGFYHFGTNNDVVESMYQLQNLVQDQTRLGPVASLAQPKQFIQDAVFDAPLRRQENEALWVENSCIPDSWTLGKRHFLTGVPENNWDLKLPDGVCLDFVPVGDSQFAIRSYGYADRFRGPLSDPNTCWLERPACDWFSERQIGWDDADIAPDIDIQLARLFPLVDAEKMTGGFVEWLIGGGGKSASNASAEKHRNFWLSSQRLSARELGQQANLCRIYDSRIEKRQSALPLMARHGAQSVFYKLDLEDVARSYAQSPAPLPPPVNEATDVMLAVHDRMFRSETLKLRNDAGWQDEEALAFRLLETAIVEPYKKHPVVPANQLASDQIVWARSPARVDLAGGWTDTPPYCMEQGGTVVNIALNLNGQPPIQAFLRCCERRSITIRSIDLGITETLHSYDELGTFRGIGSGFSVAKAALCLSGFHPDFSGAAFDSLEDQLEAFGGGLDVSMLAAIPKGSGLGTSSILAGTVLGGLNELCGFGWDRHALAARVSAVEQMLGSGGGWQDQFGGLLPGAKLIETHPGLNQLAAVRWLPNDFFSSAEFQSRCLLYYTGITRTAHDVLGEIVRGMFLNDPNRLAILESIADNSRDCFDAAQRFDFRSFAETIDRSWQLNQSLDSGTSPPEITELVGRIEHHTSAFKLAGAGGGGFLYLLTKDADHSRQLRRELTADPPNDRARFVGVSLSPSGLEVTRS